MPTALLSGILLYLSCMLMFLAVHMIRNREETSRLFLNPIRDANSIKQWATFTGRILFFGPVFSFITLLHLKIFGSSYAEQNYKLYNNAVNHVSSTGRFIFLDVFIASILLFGIAMFFTSLAGLVVSIQQ